MSSPALPFHLINAFVLPSSPHSGNQAGVVVFPSASHPKAKDDVYMLLVARDFNFAETAFVYPLGEGEWSLRWFTPEVVGPLSALGTVPTESGGYRKWNYVAMRHSQPPESSSLSTQNSPHCYSKRFPDSSSPRGPARKSQSHSQSTYSKHHLPTRRSYPHSARLVALRKGTLYKSRPSDGVWIDHL